MSYRLSFGPGRDVNPLFSRVLRPVVPCHRDQKPRPEEGLPFTGVITISNLSTVEVPVL